MMMFRALAPIVQSWSGMNTATTGTTKRSFWTVARERMEAERTVKAALLVPVSIPAFVENDTTTLAVKPSKSPKAIEVRNMRGHEYHADVIPKKSIRLHGFEHNHTTPHAYDITFKVGDTAVYGGYNLTYTGTIVSIGEKTVRIEDCGRVKALRFDDFSFWNRDFDAERIAQENSDRS